MIKFEHNDILLHEPTILDGDVVLDMRKEFLATHCKFNGTCDLDLYETYIDWLAHTIHQTHITEFANQPSSSKQTYLVSNKKLNILIGMVEIILYYNHQSMHQQAHVIACIRPSYRRQGYGKPLIKKAIQECNSFGIRKEFVTFERNSKASNDTMNKIMDF